LGVSTILRRNLSKKGKDIENFINPHTALVKEVFPQTNS